MHAAQVSFDCVVKQTQILSGPLDIGLIRRPEEVRYLYK